MRQAIETRYLGPTDSKGARVVARAQAGRVTVAWDYAADTDANHEAAARKLAAKLGWGGRLVGGGNAKGDGYVFVIVKEVTR